MTLEQLFEETHESLFRFVARMTQDPDYAMDIVQETFVRLARRWPEEGPPSRARVFQLARSLTRSGLRRRSRRSRLLRGGVHRVPVASPETPPDREAERAETRSRVRSALAELSDKERTLLLMREEGFTHREIAEAIGTTTGSVGTMVARALAKLEDRLPPSIEEAP